MSQQPLRIRTRLDAIRRNAAIGLTIIAAGPCASSAIAQSPPSGLTAPAKPTAMPAFELPTTAGPSMRSESLRGRVVVVRFWASW